MSALTNFVPQQFPKCWLLSFILKYHSHLGRKASESAFRTLLHLKQVKCQAGCFIQVFSGHRSQNSTDWCPGGSYSGLLIYCCYRAVSLGRATCCQHNCEKKYCTYGRCGLKGTFTIYVEDTETKYQSFRDTAGKGPESKRLAHIPFSLVVTWH